MTEPLNEKPAKEIKYQEFPTPQGQGTFIEEISGLFPKVAAAPTDAPRRMYQQIVTLNGIIYVYDTDSLAWVALGADTVYAGRVNSNGTAGTPFPTGWTAQTTATGFYVITHNFGHTNYTVALTAHSNGFMYLNATPGSTTFVVHFKNSSGTDADVNFEFIVKDVS